jgi:hypothetical protein
MKFLSYPSCITGVEKRKVIKIVKKNSFRSGKLINPGYVTEERETSEEAAAMGVVGVMLGPSQLIVAFESSFANSLRNQRRPNFTSTALFCPVTTKMELVSSFSRIYLFTS